MTRPALLLLVLWLPACAAAEAVPSAQPALKSVWIKGIPHVKQRPDFCGEACAEMVLRHHGVPATQDDVFGLTGISPKAARGAYTRDMKKALTALGFDVGKVWFHIKPASADKELRRLFAALHKDLRAGVPSMVCTRYNHKPGASEHLRLVVGYDAQKDEVIYHEPAVARGAGFRMKRKAFFGLWPLKYKKDRWTVVRLRMAPGKGGLSMPDRTGGTTTPAALAQAMMRAKKQAPPGFTILMEPPFVVVGNDDPGMVKLFATGTVRDTVARLRKAYFKRDPLEVIIVWLLKDKASYRATSKRLFGGRLPGTPYGFYSSEKKLMLMNIATGGGTLVHEIVHPFMEANFPNCPSWFNEGMGSLYEQSSTNGGHIVGLTNWRLAGLQRLIRAGRLPSIRVLTATTTRQFYENEDSNYYAFARYLMYYLQQQGKLHTYYHRFVRDQAKDPTGYETLRAVLGPEGKDMAAFQKKWQRFVLGLRFR